MKETIDFLNRSFTPNYIVHLTHKNKIVTFDEHLIPDFQMAIKNSDDFIGLDFIQLLARDKRNTVEFIRILSSIIKDYGTGICAMNTSFNDGTLGIPAIYLIWIVVEAKIIGGHKVKEIKIFNYIEMARKVSKVFGKHMLCPVVSLTKLFQHSVQEKSIYFAFESLKSFGTFASSDELATKTNQQQLADIMYPFHKTKTPQLTQRFVSEFLRPTGYIEYDKNRQINDLTLETLNRVTCRHLIPFNSLDLNFIIQLS